MPTCPICGINVKQPKTGRPKVYCSNAHKAKAKRQAAREADRASIAAAAAVSGTPAVREVTCHVCQLRPATRGVPRPLLCEDCSRA